MMMLAGIFPTQEKLMYIWNTVADSARGVESAMSAIRPPELILSTKLEMTARTMNQVTIPGFRVIHRYPVNITPNPAMK
jgi:hypothetical protein